MRDRKTLLKKIEDLRRELDQAIANDRPADFIYEKSIELDKVIEVYLDTEYHD